MPRSLTELMESIDSGLKQHGGELPPDRRRVGSRFAGEGADDELLDRLAGATPEELEALGLRVSEKRGRAGRQLGRGSTPIVDTARRVYYRQPLTEYEQKAMAEGSPTAGGYLVPNEISDAVLKLLRARAVVLRAGATIRPVRKELDLNTVSSGTAAAWVAENAPIPISEMVLGQQPLLRPKDLVSLTAVSLRLMRDTSAEAESAEDLVRRDVVEALTLKADDGFIQGSGVAPIPLGVKNVSGLLTPVDTGANGKSFSIGAGPGSTYQDLVAIANAPRSQNANYRKPAWFFNGRLLTSLQSILDADNEPLFGPDLLSIDADDGSTGRLLGFPFYTTSQISTSITKGTSDDTSFILFTSDMDETWVGENPDIEIDVSTEASYVDLSANWHSAYQDRQALIRGIARYDIGVRRPQLWCYVDGVRP